MSDHSKRHPLLNSNQSKPQAVTINSFLYSVAFAVSPCTVAFMLLAFNWLPLAGRWLVYSAARMAVSIGADLLLAARAMPSMTRMVASGLP